MQTVESANMLTITTSFSFWAYKQLITHVQKRCIKHTNVLQEIWKLFVLVQIAIAAMYWLVTHMSSCKALYFSDHCPLFSCFQWAWPQLWHNISQSFPSSNLKPHVRHQRVYRMGTSGLCWSPWLLPHNVLPNAQNAGSAGKRTQPGVHRPNGPQFNMAVRVTSEHTYARNAWAGIRAVHIIGLLNTEVVWQTSQSLHAICCIWIGVGIGCAMAFERWVWANEISIFFYVEISALLTYGNGWVARTQIPLLNDLETAFACRHLRLK